MSIDVPVMAGMVSTAIFVLSTVPMLCKAFTTRDLRSYSLGNIVLANTGNAIHSLYVFHLPPGPIWLLHAFYLVTTGLMLLWYLRYEGSPSGAFSALRSVRSRRGRSGRVGEMQVPSLESTQRGRQCGKPKRLLAGGFGNATGNTPDTFPVWGIPLLNDPRTV